MPKLILKFDDRMLNEYDVDSEVTIGRLPDNTIIIDNPAVSGHHARIFVEGDDYVLEDLRSKNGTYVNDKHVLKATLQNRDVLLVGKHQLVFDEYAATVSTADRPAPSLLRSTAYLNTKKHRAMLAKLRDERNRQPRKSDR